MSVSRETERLSAYATMLRKWNPTINLVAPKTLPELESRHIADSLQLANISLPATGSWVDLGSGGGLPGVVIAISRPDTQVTLVESDRRKCSFLRSVSRELALDNLTIVNQRIETADRLGSANISARALAPLPLLMSYVARHLAASGRAWLMKGRNWHAEVAQAKEHWKFELIAHASKTDPEAAILEMTGIQHV